MTGKNERLEPPGGTGVLAGRPVARIGFGAMQLGGGRWRPACDRDTALSVLRRAVALGINHIDTAHFYGEGVANELIRAALHPYADDIVLVSKVGAAQDGRGGLTRAQRPEQLRAGVEANLRGLAVEQIDVVNLRLMNAAAPEDVPKDQRVDLDSQLAEMVALRTKGKIGAIGVSSVTLAQLRQALPTSIVCVQNPYNVLDRTGEDMLDVCREHALAWVPYFPLGSAFSPGSGHPGVASVTEHPAVLAAAASLRGTPAQIGLAWLLAHDAHTLVIPGTSNVAHLEDNIATGDVHLDADTMAVLDALAPPDRSRP